MRTFLSKLLPLVIMSATTACSSSCASSPAVQRNEQAAVACLPVHLPRIVACHTAAPRDAAAEAVCIAVEVTSLASCWMSSAPSGNSAPSSGSDHASTPRA